MIAPAAAERFFSLRFAFILLFAAAAVHILSALSAMSNTQRSAYSLLAAELAANKMTVLPPIRPGRQHLPFMSTDARYALCRFDTSKGPVAVTAELPDHGWTLGVFDRDGTSAYFAAAPAGRSTKIALILMPGDDRFTGLTPEALGKMNTGDAPLAVSARAGLIVVRAPDKGLAYAAEAEAGLAKAACTPKAY